VGHLLQPSCRSRVTYSRLHRAASRWVLNISREGDSTTYLGSLFQCSVTLRGKKFFLMFRRNFLCFSLCPLPLVLSLGITEKSGPILLTPTLEIYRLSHHWQFTIYVTFSTIDAFVCFVMYSSTSLVPDKLFGVVYCITNCIFGGCNL